jgi:hypothetical protein
MSLTAPEREVFSETEFQIINERLDKYAELDGREMEQVAHQEPGWQMTSNGEEMPYERALLARTASPSFNRAREGTRRAIRLVGLTSQCEA